MRTSRRTKLWAVLGGLALAVSGCRVSVEAPPASSVSEIRGRTLARIAEMEKSLAQGKATRGGTRELAVSVRYLRGHMTTVGVGTEEQLHALDEIVYRLAQLDRAAMAVPPPHWRPDEDDTPPPEPLIEPGPMRELLPQIRRVVESIPDSDLRPGEKTPEQRVKDS